MKQREGKNSKDMRHYSQQVLVIDELWAYRKRKKNRESFPDFCLRGLIGFWDHSPGWDTEQFYI